MINNSVYSLILIGPNKVRKAVFGKNPVFGYHRTKIKRAEMLLTSCKYGNKENE